MLSTGCRGLTGQTSEKTLPQHTVRLSRSRAPSTKFLHPPLMLVVGSTSGVLLSNKIKINYTVKTKQQESCLKRRKFRLLRTILCHDKGQSTIKLTGYLQAQETNSLICTPQRLKYVLICINISTY